MRLDLPTLAAATGGRWLGPAPSAGVACEAVTIDSRQVQPGSCFVALPGRHVDGHDFVGEAWARGAACVIVARDIEAPRGPCLRVNDPVAALAGLATVARDRFGGRVVAVTGSVGKTSTRHMIAAALARRWRVHQSPKNFNNHIGLPLTLLNAPPDTEILVLELGSNHPGEIAHLAAITRPHVAVTTNAYPAHLEGFGDLDTVRREKLSLAGGLDRGGLFVVSADCPGLLEALTARPANTITFGLSERADLRGRRVDYGADRSTVQIEGRLLTIGLPGPGNVQNALASWAVARHLGLPWPDFAAALADLPAVDQRCQVRRIGSWTVIDDCYNANPQSMRNALQTLEPLCHSPRRRAVFVCGDMAELGDQAEILHRQLGHDIAESCVDRVIAVGPGATLAAHTAARLTNGRVKTTCYPDRDSACRHLVADIEENDVILIKGSRSVGLESVLDHLETLRPETTH